MTNSLVPDLLESQALGVRSKNLCLKSPPGDSGVCKKFEGYHPIKSNFFSYLRQGVTSCSHWVLWGRLNSLFCNPFSLHGKACSIVLLKKILIYLPGETAGLDDPLGLFQIGKL